MNNMFEDIDRLKVDLPKIKSIKKEVKNQSLNFYQATALVTFAILFCLGIILGNLFPACTASTGLYTQVCAQKEFNFSLMIFFWGVSFLGCVLFYAIGHIISLLTSINENLSKRK